MCRHLSSITRLLAQKTAPNPVGRPKGMSEEQIDRAVKVLDFQDLWKFKFRWKPNDVKNRRPVGVDRVQFDSTSPPERVC